MCYGNERFLQSCASRLCLFSLQDFQNKPFEAAVSFIFENSNKLEQTINSTVFYQNGLSSKILDKFSEI